MTEKNRKIILAKWWDEEDKEKRVSIEDYLNLVKKQDKTKISEFIYQRFYTRYIKPFEYSEKRYKKMHKNGFSIMANCCLLIESLESFKNGWETTDRKSQKAFESFFKSEPEFEEIKKARLEQDFYKNIRCGILHQAETTNGWTIDRISNKYFNAKTKKIDATKFMEKTKKTLKCYKDKLKNDDWDSEIWDNFRRKMRKIISNCKHKS